MDRYSFWTLSFGSWMYRFFHTLLWTSCHQDLFLCSLGWCSNERVQLSEVASSHRQHSLLRRPRFPNVSLCFSIRFTDHYGSDPERRIGTWALQLWGPSAQEAQSSLYSPHCSVGCRFWCSRWTPECLRHFVWRALPPYVLLLRMSLLP